MTQTVQINGTVGSNTAKIAVTQTVTASSAYSAGNCVGGLVTLANAARSGAGSGLIQGVTVTDKSGSDSVLDVIFLSGNPASTTVTDKSAVAINTADITKAIGVAHITDWTLGAASTMGIGQDPGFKAVPFVLDAATTSLYAIIVTRGTPTFASTSDVTIVVRLLQD